jgi:ABC-type multidrug transport system ATPase subunit
MSVKGINAFSEPQEEDGSFKISADDPSKVLPELLHTLFTRGLHVTSVNVKESSLEEAFLKLTSEREAKA